MQSSGSLEHADRIQEVADQEAGAEETREFRIFGPPGTGKTTNVTRQVRRAVERYGPGGVLVTSFSRAAAAELAGRDLPIAGDRIGNAALALLARLGRAGDRGVTSGRMEPG